MRETTAHIAELLTNTGITTIHEVHSHGAGTELTAYPGGFILIQANPAKNCTIIDWQFTANGIVSEEDTRFLPFGRIVSTSDEDAVEGLTAIINRFKGWK